MNIIFWEFLLLDQIFFSSQVQWSVIINNKHGIYELPDELLKDIRLRILENYERSRKSKNFILPMTADILEDFQLPSKKFLATPLNITRFFY